MLEALLILIGLSGIGKGAPAQTLIESAEPRKLFRFSLLPVPSADLARFKSSSKFTFGTRIDRQMVESSKTQIVCGLVIVRKSPEIDSHILLPAIAARGSQSDG